MTIGAGLVQVRGAHLIDGKVVWPGSEPNRNLAFYQRAWRFIGPAPLRLGEGERFILATRLHWTIVAKDVTKMGAAPLVAFLVGQVIGLVAVGVWWLTLTVWLSVVAHSFLMCHHVLGWRAQLLVVTDRRMMFVKGVFSNRVEVVNLARHTDLTIDQSYWQRLWGYGTVRIESGGKHDDGASREFIHHVPDPDTLIAAVYGVPSL